jgi:hypothetical protein
MYANILSEEGIKIEMYLEKPKEVCGQRVWKYKLKYVSVPKQYQSRYITWKFRTINCDNYIIENVISLSLQQIESGNDLFGNIDWKFSAKEVVQGVYDVLLLNEHSQDQTRIIEKRNTKYLSSIQPGKIENSSKKGILSDSKTDVIPNAEVDAEFPGGNLAWRKFIDSVLNQNFEILAKEGLSGTATVLFVIEKDGKVNDVRSLDCSESGVNNCLGPETQLSKLLVYAVKNGPKWKPAMQNGVPFRAYRRQSASLQFQME